jgi:hypothetical protein
MTIDDELSDDLGAAQAVADDIRAAQAECVRRGWFRALGNGRFAITESGEDTLFDWLATPQTYH